MRLRSPHPRDDRLPVFASWSVPNYRRYFVGAMVSNNGTWMQRIAQDWVVFQLTGGSGLAVGITMALQFGPMLIFGLYGGILADRYPQRRLLMITQTVMLVLSTALAVITFTGLVTVEWVYLIALLFGIVTTLDNPARQSFVGVIVPPRLLANAVALNSGNFNLARLTGPALAGLLIAVAGAGWAFLLNSLSYLPMIYALATLNAAEFEEAPRNTRGGLSAMREGLVYVARHPRIVITIVLVFFIGTFGFNFPIILTAYSAKVFGGDSALYGVLNSMMAIGSVLGAMLAARREEVTPRRLALTAGAFGTALFVLSLIGWLPMFMAALIVSGLAGVSFNAMANASVQLESDPTVRGRVMSLYFMVMMGTTPLGALIIGWVTDSYGAPVALGLSGVICVVAALGCLGAFHRLGLRPAEAI